MVVSVAFPITIDGLYDYSVPSALHSGVRCGMPVRVPLRKQLLWGVVVAIKEHSDFPNLKEIMELKGESWTQNAESLMKLYQWISDYYQAPLGKVFKPLIKKSLADKKEHQVVYYQKSALVVEGCTKKQQEVVDALPQTGDRWSAVELKTQWGLSDHMIRVLTLKGVLEKSTSTQVRESAEAGYQVSAYTEGLSEEQTQAVDTIWKSASAPVSPFLLHGVTGSGKTHVYISLAKKVLREGRGVIFLVPEIALTPQTIGRISSALDEPVAVMHSRMSDGERRDSVEQIVSGQRRVVIGVRSAILVPMQNPGLIVVDEEHDSSYKQSDPEPRYSARDVAIMRGKFQHALVVLGSATPSVESYYNALEGKYTLVQLIERYGEGELPKVQIVNMHAEQAQGRYGPLSLALENALVSTVEVGKQAVILLNRRGYAVSLTCGTCGEVRQCPHCAVNLVYHRNGDVVLCHHCGYKEQPNFVCGSCHGSAVAFTGTGIQKVESYLQERYPHFRIIRMDQDTTSHKGGHRHIIQAFENHEADILLGTQMVAKGLNFPKVTLVGVLQADRGMALPDFRSSERLFQLLTQVAGRAGRVDAHGKVLIQTFQPEEPAIVAAQNHDYRTFFDQAIPERREVGYPPFMRLARLIFSGTHEKNVAHVAQEVADFLRKNGPTLTILGPVEALITKLQGSYRYALLVKSGSPRDIQQQLAYLRTQMVHLPSSVRIKIDVDPVSMG